MKSNTLLAAIALFANIILLGNNTLASPVYECKDSNGQIIFTDNPKATPDCNAATQKTIHPLPSFTPPSRNKDHSINKGPTNAAVPKKNVIIANSEEEVTAGSDDTGEYEQNYSELSITSPTSGAQVNSCGGLLDISFNVSPALAGGDLAVLAIDGTPYGEPTANTTISTNSLERGPHSIFIKIISKDNKILKTSAPVEFMFMRNCAKNKVP